VDVEPINGCAISAIALVGEKASEFFAAFARAMGDGVITESERPKLLQEMLEVVAFATEAAAILEGVRK
jgi:hypothetical protein